MPLKNLEHDGFEDFPAFSNREEIKNRIRNKKKKSKSEEAKQQKEKYLAKEQELYLQTEPSVWDGDAD